MRIDVGSWWILQYTEKTKVRSLQKQGKVKTSSETPKPLSAVAKWNILPVAGKLRQPQMADNTVFPLSHRCTSILLNRSCTTHLRLVSTSARKLDALKNSKAASAAPSARRAKNPPGQSPIRIWPLVLIFAGGTYLFTQLVKSRRGTAPPSKDNVSSRPF
jgi:hypothetical protein